MNTLRNKYLSIFSLTFMTIITLVLPSIITITMVSFASLSIASYYLIQNYDINYKYWFSFAGQLCALIFVATSFVVGLSFIANGIA